MNAIVDTLYLVVSLYAWLIVIRALLSWFRPSPGSAFFSIYELLGRVTEPYLRLFRRYLPMGRLGGAGLDLTPLVGLVVLFVLMRVLARL